MQPAPVDLTSEDRSSLTTYLLGVVEVEDLLAAQRRLIFELEESGDVALILCEHAFALTIGRSGSRAHIVPDDDELKIEGLTPKWVQRGGGCWLHTPGQLAGYLIGKLPILANSAQNYMHTLEHALVRVMADFDVPAKGDLAHDGLYVSGKRVAALGVSVFRDMVHYGFLLNVGPYMRPFEQLEEPGLDETRSLKQTSMEAVRVRPVPPARLRSRLIEEIRDAFKLEPGPVFTETSGFSPLPEVGKRHVSQ